MRESSSSLVFWFCVATGAAIAACSGTTETPFRDGEGGSGGAGGPASSATGGGTTTTTTTSATSTTSSATGGGGTVCDEACERAADCGSDLCNRFPIDCSDPRFACAAQCILDAEECEQLSQDNPNLSGCVLACINGQGGQGGGGEGGGASGQDCLVCAGQARCLPECASDAACQDWLQCAQTCFFGDPQPGCFDACDARFPGAEPRYTSAYACACTSCVDRCGAVVDPCN